MRHVIGVCVGLTISEISGYELYGLLFGVGTCLALECVKGNLQFLKELTGVKLYIRNLVLIYFFWFGSIIFPKDYMMRMFMG